MELVVLGTKGIDGDSILSVRVGSSRKQAVVKHVDKPFRFPCRAEECGGIKIEVLSLVGVVRTVCVGGHRQDFDLALKPTAGAAAAQPEASISFRVQPIGGGGEAEDAPAAAKSRAQSKNEADAYLAEHDVLATFQEVMQVLLRDKPADPHVFCARQFAETAAEKSALFRSEEEASWAAAEARSASKASAPREPSEKTAPSRISEESSSKAEECASTLVSAPAGPALPPVQSGDAELLQQLAKLRRENAELRAALAAVPAQPDAQINRLRDHGRKCLEEASEISRLAQALVLGSLEAPRPMSPWQSSLRLLVDMSRPSSAKGAEVTILPAELPAAMASEAADIFPSGLNSVDELRGRARDAIESAIGGGQLLEALARAFGQAAPPPDAARKPETQAADIFPSGLNSVDELRGRAREAIESAIDGGQLLEALARAFGQAAPPPPDAAHKPETQEGEVETTKAAPVEATGGGCAESQVVDHLRGLAREELLRAAADGGFLAALAEAGADEDEAEKLREHAREALRGQCATGEVFRALQEVSAEVDAEEHLRSQVRVALSRAAADGSIFQCLLQGVEGTGSDGPSHAANDEPGEADALRAHAREALSSQCASGELFKALLDSAAEVEEEDAIKLEVRSALTLAAADGSILECLLQGQAEDAQEDEADGLREHAREALRDKCATGELFQALLDSGAEVAEEDKVRSLARSALTQAATDGTILEMLQAADGSVVDEATLRSKAREAFTKAAADGNLFECLLQGDTLGPSELSLSQQLRGELEDSAAQASGSAAVNEKARSAISRAAEDATLFECLLKSAAAGCSSDEQHEDDDESPDALRTRLRGSLMQATVSGRLQKRLSQTSLNSPKSAAAKSHWTAPSDSMGEPDDSALQVAPEATPQEAPQEPPAGEAVRDNGCEEQAIPPWSASPGCRKRFAKIEHQVHEVKAAAKEHAELVAELARLQALIDLKSSQKARRKAAMAHVQPTKFPTAVA